MSMQCSRNLPRAISVAQFICEDGGHNINEAAKEFKLSHTTIERDLNYLGVTVCSDYHDIPNIKELRALYLKTVSIVRKRKHSKKEISIP